MKPFALRKQIWRHGNNMLSLLQHPQAELPVSDIVEPPQKGLHGITAKLRQKVCTYHCQSFLSDNVGQTIHRIFDLFNG